MTIQIPQPVAATELGRTLAHLAGLLEYPGDDFAERCAAAPGAGAAALAALEQEEREELYTAAFDVTPACVPYVSIHLFGEENFKRGQFMAALQARHAEAGFHASGELPDHISAMLRFAAHVGAAERRELVEFCLLHPLSRMIGALGEGHPYRTVLSDVEDALREAYPDVAPAPCPREEMQHHGAGCRGCAVEDENDTERVPNT